MIKFLSIFLFTMLGAGFWAPLIHGAEQVQLEGVVGSEEDDEGNIRALFLTVHNGDEAAEEYTTYRIDEGENEKELRSHVYETVKVTAVTGKDNVGNSTVQIISYTPPPVENMDFELADED